MRRCHNEQTNSLVSLFCNKILLHVLILFRIFFSISSSSFWCKIIRRPDIRVRVLVLHRFLSACYFFFQPFWDFQWKRCLGFNWIPIWLSQGCEPFKYHTTHLPLKRVGRFVRSAVPIFIMCDLSARIWGTLLNFSAQSGQLFPFDDKVNLKSTGETNSFMINICANILVS